MIMTMTRIFLLICILFVPASLVAQEIDCDVTINTDALDAEGKDNLVDFVTQVKQYINGFRWTQEEFGDEKIKCSLTISFQSVKDASHFTAQAFIGSQRPIFKANRNTAVIRIIDDKWEFDYVRFQSLSHSEYRFDPLLSFLDFYVYLMLGYDADTYKDTYKAGKGMEYFQKATEIVNRARGSAGSAKGWDVSSQNTYSRAQLIEELVNPKFQVVREALYEYHYRGLDYLFKDEVKARKIILSSLEKIAKFQNKINQRTLIIRTFFDTKYMEIIDVFSKEPDFGVYDKLGQFDPVHLQNYEEAKKKRF
jgi:hypothetical protein